MTRKRTRPRTVKTDPQANGKRMSGGGSGENEILGLASNETGGRSQSGINNLFELETTFRGDKGNDGAMFDISCPPGEHEIQIVGMEIHVNTIDPECPVLVYGRQGTHEGFENSTQGWMMLVNTTIACRGFGARTIIPGEEFMENPTLVGGEVYALYATLLTPNLRYSSGVQLGAVYASSEFMRIHEGTGVSWPFGGELDSFVHPRVWNGVIKYEVLSANTVPPISLDEGCDGSISTIYEDNLGSYGNMFDIKTYQHTISVTGINFYTDLLGPVTYEIFTRSGSFSTALSSEHLSQLIGNGSTLPRANNSGDFSNGEEGSIAVSISANSSTVEGDATDWILVKRGTTNGLGSGRGTPVRNFAPIMIPPETLQGFYVTLTTPDIRYRDVLADNSSLRRGDPYVQNDDLEIQIGASVGTYPVDRVFYEPRLWSGTIEYIAQYPCPTEVPSQSPTEAPSLAASVSPTSQSTYLGNCTETSSLETTLLGGSRAFGNMFTVTTRDEPVSVTGLEIHFANTTTSRVTVYSKPGDYRGFEHDPSAWTILSQTSVVGAGRGKPTVIPEDLFQAVHIFPHQTRAFYVSLSSADILYTRISAPTGTPYSSNSFIAINLGAGLTDPDFGPSIYEQRVFNGILHYRRAGDCVPITKTTVIYPFEIQHTSTVDTDTIVNSVGDNVHQTISTLLQVAPQLASFVVHYQFEVTQTFSSVATTGNCDPANSALICTPVDTFVELNHKETLEEGKVIYTMLTFKDAVSANLNLNQFRAEYAGDIPVDAEMLITLNGNFTSQLTDSQRDYFESQTRTFLNKQLLEQDVNVLGVQVVLQSVSSSGDRSRRLQRDDSADSSSSLSMSTTITGEYRPPPYVNFDSVVEDAIDADGGAAYRDELSLGTRERPEELDLFTKVTAVSAVSTSSNQPTQAPSSPLEENVSSSIPIPLIAGVCGGVAVFLVLIWWLIRARRRRRATHAAVVDLGGTLKKYQGGMFGNHNTDGLFEDDILDAECDYVINPYTQQQQQMMMQDDKQLYKNATMEGIPHGYGNHQGVQDPSMMEQQYLPTVEDAMSLEQQLAGQSLAQQQMHAIEVQKMSPSCVMGVQSGGDLMMNGKRLPSSRSLSPSRGGTSPSPSLSRQSSVSRVPSLYSGDERHMGAVSGSRRSLSGGSVPSSRISSSSRLSPGPDNDEFRHLDRYGSQRSAFASQRGGFGSQRSGFASMDGNISNHSQSW